MMNNKCWNFRGDGLNLKNTILDIMMICSNEIYDVKDHCSNGQSYFEKCVDYFHAQPMFLFPEHPSRFLDFCYLFCDMMECSLRRRISSHRLYHHWINFVRIKGNWNINIFQNYMYADYDEYISDIPKEPKINKLEVCRLWKVFFHRTE